jgi:hypothetical protein
MLVIQDSSIDSCLVNILLQNLANNNNKNLCTHFVDPNAFSVLLKNINDWYIEDRSFVWIVGIPMNNDIYKSLKEVVENSACKFIYIDSSEHNEKQQLMLEYLSRNSNFKLIENMYGSNSKNVFEFMKNKQYPLAVLNNILDIINVVDDFTEFDSNYSSSYRLHTLFNELGYQHFKENFIDGIFKDGLRLRSDSIIERKKKHIKRLYEKSVIQQENGIVLAMTEFNIMYDLIYFTDTKQKILNMITLDDEIHIELFINGVNISRFLEEIMIKKYFQSEIISFTGIHGHGVIRLREKIKYSSAISIIKYLHSELLSV